MKSVLLPENVHKDLVNLKLSQGASSAAEVIHQLIIEHRKRKFLQASEKIRERAAEKGITLDDALKEAKKIRKEIYAKWFDDSN